jgi:hypothetical protein
MKKRVLDRLRVQQDQRTLPEVVNRQRRPHDAEPREADRGLAEVAHIGIQRLGASHREEDCAEHRQRQPAFDQQEAQPIERVQCEQYLGVARDPPRASGRDADEPHQRDRAEPSAHRAGPVTLCDVQGCQHREGDRHDVRFERRCRNLQSLDRRQHRDRRGDDAVTVEQRRAEDAHDDQRAMHARLVVRVLAGQRHERHGPAFAVVVRAQYERHVLERDDDRQAPEDERQHAQHVVARDLDMAGVEHLSHGIEWAGTDVAVDDAQGTQCEGSEHCGPARGIGHVVEP